MSLAGHDGIRSAEAASKRGRHGFIASPRTGECPEGFPLRRPEGFPLGRPEGFPLRRPAALFHRFSVSLVRFQVSTNIFDDFSARTTLGSLWRKIIRGELLAPPAALAIMFCLCALLVAGRDIYDGAATVLLCATSPELNSQRCLYYADCRVKSSSAASR